MDITATKHNNNQLRRCFKKTKAGEGGICIQIPNTGDIADPFMPCLVGCLDEFWQVVVGKQDTEVDGTLVSTRRDSLRDSLTSPGGIPTHRRSTAGFLLIGYTCEWNGWTN